jgi:transposase
VAPARTALPQYNLNLRAAPLRQAINGMLYQHAHRGQRLPWPVRYGKATAVQSRKHRCKKNGTFAAMLKALEDKPEPARIVPWLRDEVDAASDTVRP